MDYGKLILLEYLNVVTYGNSLFGAEIDIRGRN